MLADVNKCLKIFAFFYRIPPLRSPINFRAQFVPSVDGDTIIMPRTYYAQECPTCGRSLQIHVEHMGKQVVCQHCQANFVACDPSNACDRDTDSVLRRVDDLLDAAAQRKEVPR